MNIAAAAATILVALLGITALTTQAVWIYRGRHTPPPSPPVEIPRQCCVYCSTVNELGDPYALTWPA